MFDFIKRNRNVVKSHKTSSRTSSRVVTGDRALQHEWTIDHFDRCHLDGITEANLDLAHGIYTPRCSEQHPYLYSTKFIHFNDPKIDFRLVLYPCGSKEANKNYISLYLYSNCTAACPLWVKLSLMDSYSNVIKSDRFFKVFGSKAKNIEPGWGSHKLVRRKWLEQSGWGKFVLKDNKLTVQCKIRYVADVKTVET